MYSRYGDDGKRPVRLPEHYGGSAFAGGRGEAPAVRRGEPSHGVLREGSGEKISPAADRFLRAESADRSVEELPEPTPSAEPAENATPQQPTKAVAPPEKAQAGAGLSFEGLRRLFANGAGEEQDRLLLLGLILLLSRTGGDSDILLWLSLLLLCG